MVVVLILQLYLLTYLLNYLLSYHRFTQWLYIIEFWKK
jgi:hypothetical protein